MALANTPRSAATLPWWGERTREPSLQSPYAIPKDGHRFTPKLNRHLTGKYANHAKKERGIHSAEMFAPNAIPDPPGSFQARPPPPPQTNPSFIHKSQSNRGPAVETNGRESDTKTKGNFRLWDGSNTNERRVEAPGLQWQAGPLVGPVPFPGASLRSFIPNRAKGPAPYQPGPAALVSPQNSTKG